MDKVEGSEGLDGLLDAPMEDTIYREEDNQDPAAEYDLAPGMTFSEIQHIKFPSYPWIVEGLIREKSLALLAGGTGLGKSPLVYQLATCVAAGIPFCGRKTREGLVYIFDYENAGKESQIMINSISKYLGLPSAPGNAFVVSHHNNEKMGFASNLQNIKKMNPSLCIIDSVTAAWPKFEKDNESARWVYNHLREEITSKMNTSVLLVHHIRKRSQDMMGYGYSLTDFRIWRQWFQQVRGPQTIIDGCDLRLGIDEHEGTDSGVVIGGYSRVSGEIKPIFLERARDEFGEPVCFVENSAEKSSIDRLSDEDRYVFNKLPDTFRVTEGMSLCGLSANKMYALISHTIRLGLLNRSGKKYLKSNPSAPPAQPASE